MKIGVLVSFKQDVNIDEKFRELAAINLNACQVCIWNEYLFTDENAELIKTAAKNHGIEITALWAGWDGPMVWDFYMGPQTLGLVPAAYRFSRLKQLFKASDFAEKLGVTDVITHVGFLPENPLDPDFAGTVGALRSLAQYMKEKGQYFLFETGQETPVTMLRAIEEIGTDNLGINFDTANLILYGKANSVDALEVFGKYVRNTHIKDGLYPTCGKKLGREVPAGEGKANFPAIIDKLKSLGYKGPYIIEREISGEKQMQDIIRARDMLIEILKKYE